MKTNLYKAATGCVLASMLAITEGCSGSGGTSGNGQPPVATQETNSVLASILDDTVTAKVGTTANLPITFSVKKIGDTASNFNIDTSNLPANIHLVNHCNGNVTDGNGCYAMLSYTGTSASQSVTGDKSLTTTAQPSLDAGILPVKYHFTNSSGQEEHGVLAVPYQSVTTTHLKVFRTSPGVIVAKKNRKVIVPLSIASADGCPLSSVSIETLDKNNNDVTLSSTKDGNDGLLYSNLTKSEPLTFILHPQVGSVDGLHKVHFRLLSNAAPCSGATTNSVQQSKSLQSTVVNSSQDYTLNYSVSESALNVVTTVTPSNNIVTALGESIPVGISFNTSSGIVTNLTAQAPQFTPASEASFWTVNSYTLPCATVNTLSNNCTINLTYMPTTSFSESGVAEFPYTYSMANSGKTISENGVVLIDFSTSSANSVYGVAQTTPVTVGTSGNVTVNFTTNFGVANNFSLTGINGQSITQNTAGLSLTSPSSCNNVGIGGGCSVSFNYTPPVVTDPLTLNTSVNLNYTYTDIQGNVDSGTTVINLQPVYPMIFVATGNAWNFNLYNSGNSQGPEFGVYSNSQPFNASGVFSGTIGTGGSFVNLTELANLPGGGTTAYTGAVFYDDMLYISSVFSNITSSSCSELDIFCRPSSSGTQYGNIFAYSLQNPPTETVASVVNTSPSSNSMYNANGVGGFVGVAIGNNNLLNPSYGGPYLFAPSEAIYNGPIFGTTPGQLSIGSGTAAGVCSIGGALSSCMTSSAPNSLGYNFYGNYDGNQVWQNVNDGSMVWGWVVPAAYTVDGNGNFYMGVNAATDPLIGANYSNTNLVKCSPNISGSNCSIWWTAVNNGGTGGPWIQSVTSDNNYVYYGDSVGNYYKCSLNAANACSSLGNPIGGVFINAMAADGNGNLFVGGNNGSVWNPVQNDNVLFSTIGNAGITAMTYYAPNQTLYFGDANGVIYACPVTNGAFNGAACQSLGINPGVSVNSISIATLN